MDANPHTHKVRIVHYIGYGSYIDGLSRGETTFIQYGDTRVRLARWWNDPTRWSKDKIERRVAAATAKAVRRHDEGSRKAGEREAREDAKRRTRAERERAVGATLDSYNAKLLETPQVVLDVDDPWRSLRPAYGPVARHDVWGTDVLAEKPAQPLTAA
jgi:hypothetical protein